MSRYLLLFFSSLLHLVAAQAQELPFQHKVEVYRSEEAGVTAFTLRLEQPFLAEEFEQSNYLRLRSDNERAYLIYPKQAKFQQKHAEFYGRLHGSGTVELTLAYETVSENLDGTRRVDNRQGVIEITIPEAPADGSVVGSPRVFQDWARQQNEHFLQLLQYYPDESFFQYCLLQSKARYGIEPPPIPKQARATDAVETDLYEVFTGSLAVQESLQRETLRGGGGIGDQTRHVSQVRAPALRSLDYEQLLEDRLTDDGVSPSPHPLARFVPADQYFVHFNSATALGEALDLSSEWGDSLLRLFTVRARDNRLQQKFAEQLCLIRPGLEQLFADQVIGDIGLTGSDPFLVEGTDLTLILDVRQPQVFEAAASEWLASARAAHPELVEREFNYRGHKIMTNYTNDRVISSFSARHENLFIYSNSHRSIRRIIDAAIGETEPLFDALDYRYVTTLLPPDAAENSGYLFVSEACIRRLIGPAAKISQKRRIQCFNNLVMQNNASMFFRLEYGRSPNSLSELIEGRFLDPEKIVCPHGGAYTFETENDACTCSLHNRLKYLTPNVELAVLNVSSQEAAEYERYRQRYEQFWQKSFDPIAVRITMGPRVRLETCVLPFANSSYYEDLRGMVSQHPQPLDTARIAPSAVVSYLMVPGRENTAQFLQFIPGFLEVINEDPTLTDTSWVGDRISLHICDGETILEIDPTRLRSLDLPMIGKTSTLLQGLAGVALTSVDLPIYATIDIENREKGERLIEKFAERIFLKHGDVFGLPTELDAYRLPDYKEHVIHVLSMRLYAISLRLHIALVNDQLVLATKPEVLRQVIDQSTLAAQAAPAEAHMLLRLNRLALDQLHDDVALFWAEKTRLACHRNIISIYNFHELYDAPLTSVDALAEAKYGVRYFCPDGGEYVFDEATNQVVCSVHGNREHATQRLQLDDRSAFSKFFNSLDELTASLRFEAGGLITTVEIQRHQQPSP